MKINLRENEEIILKSKKHWITLISPLFQSLIALVVSLVITAFLSFTPLIGVVFSVLFLIYKIIEKYTSYWIVTNKRIIDKHGILSVNTKETQIEKINNVSYSKPFWGRIFGFGTVRIQSAAKAGAMVHHWIQNPRTLKDTIIELQEKRHGILNPKVHSPDKQLVSNISDEIEKLYELNDKGILSKEEFAIAKRKVLGNEA